MNKLDRRRVLSLGVTAVGCCCAGGTAGCAGLSGTSKTPTPPSGALKIDGEVALLDLDKVPSLTGAAASVKFEVEGIREEPIKVVVVRLDERFEAFLNECTHGGREMDFLPEEQILRCASVGHAEFDEAGRTIAGPAQEDLSMLDVEQRGRILAIALT